MATIPVTLPEPATRSRLVNQTTGIQVIKGGQTGNEGFFHAIVASYANLVNNPIVLIIGAVLLFTFIAEEGQLGPLEHFRNAINNTLSPDTPGWERSLMNFTTKLLDFLIRYKSQFVITGFAWLSYLAKPSTNSLYHLK